jgi:hypothetical protein
MGHGWPAVLPDAGEAWFHGQNQVEQGRPIMQISNVRPFAAATQKPEVGSVRSGAANSLRSVGAGLDQASEMIGVQADKMYIHPVETLYGASMQVKRVTADKAKPLQVVGSATSKTLGVGGFVAAFYGMIAGGILRAPGDTAHDLSNAVADKIDGQKTFDGSIGF